jgi:hypothetical protein
VELRCSFTTFVLLVTVCTCVAINLLSYVVTQQLSTYYQSNSSLVSVGDRVDVEFSLCFYVIMASGVVSVIAVASSLLCRHGSGTCCVAGSSSSRVGRRRRDERLVDNDNNQLYRSFLGDPSLPALPPPYEP